MRKKILLLSLFAGAAVGQTTPSQPTVILVGKLSCAARMYTPTQLHIWCFKDLTFTTLRLNMLIDVSDGFGFRLDIADTNNFDTNTTLDWLFLVTVPDPSIPPEIPPLLPVVAYRAIVTRATVADPTLSGILK